MEKGNVLDKRILFLLKKASNCKNRGNENVQAYGKACFDKAWRMYIDNQNVVEENTIKCIYHIKELFYKKKTYGSEYVNCKDYLIDNRKDDIYFEV